MRCDEWARAYRDITNDALNVRSSTRRHTTNLYLDTVPYMKDDFIGPEFQDIQAPQRCLLVFADDDPMANFGHPCRYLLYNEKTHAFVAEVQARFPPHLQFAPKTFRVFHEPVRVDRARLRTPLEITPIPTPTSSSTPTPTPPPTPVARGRYAILFSGSSERRHLNDLEYCYRMLIHRYQFTPENICVLSFNDTRTLLDGTTAKNWPEETSAPDPYQIPVPESASASAAPLTPPLPTFRANRAGFQNACQLIAAKPLNSQDLVFIHTNGHGDADVVNGQPQNPWMVGYDKLRYKAQHFCDDLATFLPAHESLLIVMEQCCSGLFIAPVLAAKGSGAGQIKASRLSMACSSTERSYGSPKGNFDQFMLSWVTAHLDQDPYGVSPGSAVAGTDGLTDASEAFAYAKSVADPPDKSASADDPAVVPATAAIAPPLAGDILLTK